MPDIYEKLIGETVTVVIDRVIGSKHPVFGFIYPINYGYVPDTMAEDNEEIDAYILGETEPLERYVGKVIAVIYRKNDVENKLVVSNYEYTVKEIIKQVDFQESFFEIEIKI